MMKDHDEAK
jgi:hypothetical protein